ncbi:MAG: CvpA family protein [Prevotellaceae bacterium]|nr:CvpA family protein [Candidatus Faecinaster equi]
MSIIDIIIIVILGWGAFSGWKSGLIKEFLSSCGLIVGFVVACLLYKYFGNILAPQIGGAGNNNFIVQILAFILIWIIVPIVLSVLSHLLSSSLKLVHLGGINSFLGMFVGIIKVYLLLFVIFCAMSYANIIDEDKKEGSLLYDIVVAPKTLITNI